MRRREFITLGAATAAWPLAVRAQQRKSTVAILSGFTDRTQNEMRAGAFKDQLRKLGWVEGVNLTIEQRQTGAVEELRRAATELVALKPDAILVMPTPAMQAVWHATRSIPVVFVNVSDPVEGGFVASLARPDGNVTGFTAFEYSIGGKWVELLKEISPTTRRALVVFHPEQYTSRGLVNSIQTSGPILGVEIKQAPVRTAADIERAIEDFARGGDGGLITPPHPLITNNRLRIFAMANQYRLVGMYPFRGYASDGGLVSYGADEPDAYTRAAGYIHRILQGEKPGDLPVQNPVKFELVVNLKTARAIGLDIPSSFLLRADEVIE